MDAYNRTKEYSLSSYLDLLGLKWTSALMYVYCNSLADRFFAVLEFNITFINLSYSTMALGI